MKFEKINVIGGSITNNPLYSGNKTAQFLNEFNLKYGNNLPNDGIVIWLKDEFEKYGIKYEEVGYSLHFDVETGELGMSLLHRK